MSVLSVLRSSGFRNEHILRYLLHASIAFFAVLVASFIVVRIWAGLGTQDKVTALEIRVTLLEKQMDRLREERSSRILAALTSVQEEIAAQNRPLPSEPVFINVEPEWSKNRDNEIRRRLSELEHWRLMVESREH